MGKHVIRIPEAEATSDFASVLAQVRAGADVIIEHDAEPVAVVPAVQPARRTISECIAPLPEDSTAMIDPDFVEDVETAILSHREVLNPPHGTNP
jgi:antitoxin (DNA-binding transcriptional repressor) of toxin-antitoxin stability system